MSSAQTWERAVRSLGLPLDEIRRPGPVRWLRYAAWGRLPPEYSAWVLYDTTAPTWIARHFARLITVVALPALVIAIWLPAPLGLRLTTAVGTGLLALFMAGVFINESTEQRLEQAGFRWGTGEAVRARRHELARRLG